MTGPSQAVHLKMEPDAPRRVAALEPSPEVPRAIGMQAKAAEHARPGVMAAIPDPRIGAMAAMRFPEGKSRETIARRMHYERSSPAEQPRRFPRGTIWSRPSPAYPFSSGSQVQSLRAAPIYRLKKFQTLACNGVV